MIGRGAHVRQPERNIHRFVKFKRLQRRERLIVIERDNDIEFAAQLPRKNRVRGNATGKPGKTHAKFFQNRLDNFDFLAPENSLLSRVRIQSANADGSGAFSEFFGKKKCLLHRA